MTWRTHFAGDLRPRHAGQKVLLCGWAETRRDHGGLVFIDLRDASGLVQVVAHPEHQKAFAAAHQARQEYVLQVQGEVTARPQGTENPLLATGGIEVNALAMEILNPAQPLPLPLDEAHPNDLLRLKYRYLDLRRPSMAKNLRLRHQAAQAARRCLDGQGFIEVETPILTRSTPEGARDFLVPSRLAPGSFYALPQSPQLFKQLLMVAGLERYYQLARCFRDEDLRADRQPEFTQIDLECSFFGMEEIMAVGEKVISSIFKETLGADLGQGFMRLTYQEALSRFGSDKPDLRNPLELAEITDLARGCGFRVFAEAAALPRGRVAALAVPGPFSRAELDALAERAKALGAKGLAWMRVEDPARGKEGISSPIAKFLEEPIIEGILQRSRAKGGDVLFFGAGDAREVNLVLGALRNELGEARGLVRQEWAPLWVVDFPLMEYDDALGRWVSLHHPFTAPVAEDLPLLDENPGKVRAQAYDLVLNGWEVGGGSIRIHSQALQQKVFSILGIDEAEALEKFGFLLEALSFGAPPHGGMAFGFDRLVALLAGERSIREVIAFPKTQRGQCPLTEAPAPVFPEQLVELGILPLPKPLA